MAGRGWKNIVKGKRITLAQKQVKLRTIAKQRLAGLTRKNGRS